jgi:hypothetical protein
MLAALYLSLLEIGKRMQLCKRRLLTQLDAVAGSTNSTIVALIMPIMRSLGTSLFIVIFHRSKLPSAPGRIGPENLESGR